MLATLVAKNAKKKILWWRLYCGLAESAFGECLESGLSGRRLCVGPFGWNQVSAAVKVSAHECSLKRSFLINSVLPMQFAKITKVK
jgi:hypothetical protein